MLASSYQVESSASFSLPRFVLYLVWAGFTYIELNTDMYLKYSRIQYSFNLSVAPESILCRAQPGNLHCFAPQLNTEFEYYNFCAPFLLIWFTEIFPWGFHFAYCCGDTCGSQQTACHWSESGQGTHLFSVQYRAIHLTYWNRWTIV